MALGLVLLSAGCSNGDGKGGDRFRGDATFGSPPPTIDQDAAAAENVEGSEGPDGRPSSDMVKLRVFHGVLNLPAVRFCYDPDYRADDPTTRDDELDPGPEPPTPMFAEFDGGVLPLALPSGYFMAGQELSGAILAYRAALPVDAGMDGGGSNNPLPLDAGGMDAALGPCDPGSLEAVLPIPLTPSWLEPPPPALDGGEPSDAGAPMPARDPNADGGPSLAERRGFVTTLSGDTPLTLFGSGSSLDPSELAARRSLARKDYLDRHPGDDAGAAAAERAMQAWLESNFGPRFLLSRGSLPARSGLFALSLVHLVPDVLPTIDAGVPVNPVLATSGALHLCVRVDESESDLSGRGANLQFRNATPLGLPFAPGASYGFRLFVEADFKSTQAICGSTSLKPVAELTVPENTFLGGRSYTLVVWGARSPDDLCTVFPLNGVAKPGCARPPDALKATVLILENDLPDPE